MTNPPITSLRSLFFALVAIASSVCAPAPVLCQQSPIPKTYWGQEPLQELSATRAQIVLNGPWQFRPALGAPDAAPAHSWGLIWVPGAWQGPSRLPGLIRSGQGSAWETYKPDALARAWYARPLEIPASWQGRAVVLDFKGVSTDAVVYVNGQNCGRVRGESGVIDITKAVVAGQKADLVVDVAATADEKDADAIFASTSEAIVSKADVAGQELQTRGITGDVILRSRPLGARIGDVFIQTSTRKKQLALQIDWADMTQASDVQLTARLFDQKGREEKRFAKRVMVSNGQRIEVSWAWPNPRLWDVRQPNLYTLKLEAKGAGLTDEYAQKFGFREFWIEGRQIFLNGTPFRMRPVNLLTADNWSEVGANHLAISNQIDAAMQSGFNIQEIWPVPRPRGTYRSWSAWYDVADQKGWPLIGVAQLAAPYAKSSAQDWAKNKADYRRDTETLLREYRNHPSIVMWGLDGNRYMHSSDQNPTNLGRKGYHDKESWYNDSIVPGLESVQITKAVDPTRPVISHAGSYVGDMHTANNYLCLTPLQEREEWLSDWAKNGEMPYCAVEFGMPLFNTFLRARDEFMHSIATEPWSTEFQAIYLGNRSYKLEPNAYRRKIRQLYDSSHAWGDQHYHESWVTNHEARNSAGLQELYALFITNTWRSWRTWGNTGGTIPWDLNHLWTLDTTKPAIDLPAFVPGTLGTYKASMPASDFYGYGDPRGGYKPLPSATALIRNNRETLAWIAGPAAAFTAKNHHFVAGQTIQKQVALLNDSRQPQNFSYSWKLMMGGKAVRSGAKSGRIEVGKTVFSPLNIVAPPLIGQATLTLNAQIGGSTHQDSFALRIYGPKATFLPAVKQPISIFDPLQKSTKMLKALGIPSVPWNGKLNVPLIVIGREALSSGNAKPALATQLEAYVRGGGKLLLLEQNPEWLRSNLGLRVAHQLSRRAFVVGSHPAMKGFDSQELRDWNGTSTLLPAKYETAKVGNNGWPLYPRWGWRWGNRHAISSGAVEKPHYGGWRPLLEAEFDLAYSPLMELDYGKGRFMLCTLDLEDHATIDPAAARLTRRILQYAQESKPQPRAAKVIFVGADSSQLDALGLHYTRSDKLVPDANLVIIGADAKIDEASLTSYLTRGGKLFFLPRTDEKPVLSVNTRSVKDFGGSIQVPAWPEAAGLSPSDLRWRSFAGARLLQGQAETGADGLLARKIVGKGVALFCQIDPAGLEADKFTYMRFTRWRQTRAISQLLANLGASFKADKSIFLWATPKTLSLTGTWQAKITQQVSGVAEAEDKSISSEARQLVAGETDGATWQQVKVPQDWSGYGAEWTNLQGEAVFQKTIDVPTDWAGKELQLDLGAIEDFDNTYFNGVQIGASGDKIPTWALTKRYYTVPARLVKAGKNVIAVRVWNKVHGGGLKGGEGSGPLKAGPDQMQLVVNEFYHSDYRRDFKLGDDPYRYYRW